MTRQTTQHPSRLRRFSGPDLAQVLKRVHEEYGDDATISEVKKARTGGLAGFFVREEFEVIVEDGPPAVLAFAPEPRGATSEDDQSSTAASALVAPRSETSATSRFRLLLDQTIDEREQAEASVNRFLTTNAGASRGARLSVEPSPQPPSSKPDLQNQPRVEPEVALDDLPLPDTDPIDDESDDLSDRVADDRLADDLSDGVADDRLADVAEDRLLERMDDVDVDVVDAEARALRATLIDGSSPSQARSAPLPVGPRPATEAETETETVSVAEETPTQPAEDNTGDFWARLQQARNDLRHLRRPPEPIVAVIGPLASTAPVVRRLQHQRASIGAKVIVLSQRTEIVSEPSWELVRRGSQLGEALSRNRGSAAILVLDVGPELPTWVGSLSTELRERGVGLVHVGLDEPTDETLGSLHALIGEPLVVEVIRPLDPARAVELIDGGEPIASIAGMPIGPEVLVALRREIDTATAYLDG